MKVVHVEDYFDPEAGYQINELIRAHKKNSDDVILITSDDMSIFHKKVNPEIDKKYEEEMGIKIIRLKPKLKLASRLLFPKLFNIIDEINPDLVFLHGIGDFKDLVLFSKKKDYKIVRDCHMSWVASKNKFRKFYYFFYNKFFSSRINNTEKYEKIYALGDEEHQYLLKIGIDKEKIEYLKHGYNSEVMFYSEKERIKIRKNYNIPQENIVISYIGKFDEFKRPDYIFDIIKNVPLDFFDKNPMTLIFIGKKNQKYMKKFNAKASGLSNMVQLIVDESKEFNELNKYFSASDICIFPEETTLSSIHAQICGCPVMMVNYESNRERVINQDNLFEPYDFKNAAQKLVRIIDSKEYLKQEVMRNNKELLDREYSNQINTLRKIVS